MNRKKRTLMQWALEISSPRGKRKLRRIARRMRSFEKSMNEKAERIADNGGSARKVDDALWLAECGRLHAEQYEKRSEE